uniref:C2 domain-containing protein n=1 Tax=Nelumbo nucifera TaxID=4432 RepID=A0A822YTX9_NELNU|nr:TPA_asm: hypothetical protein HUJ06_006627 [Nelumbo nucifera]
MERYRTVNITIVSAEIFMARSDIRVYAETYMDDDPGEKKLTGEERGLNPKWGTTMRFEVREKMLRRNRLIIKLRRKRSLVSDKTIGKVRISRNDLVNHGELNQALYYNVYKDRLLSSPERRGRLIVSFRLEEVCYRKVPNKVMQFFKGVAKFGFKTVFGFGFPSSSG